MRTFSDEHRARLSASAMGNTNTTRLPVTFHGGYAYVDAPEGHPYTCHHGRIRRSRAVMEKHLGRILKPSEMVHHKDGSKDNDVIENLEVMSLGQHNTVHKKGAKRKRHSDATRAKMSARAKQVWAARRADCGCSP